MSLQTNMKQSSENFCSIYFATAPANIPVLIKLGQTTVVLMPNFFKLYNSCLNKEWKSKFSFFCEIYSYVNASCNPTAANFDEQ